jgi:hypothetical protein
MEIGGALRRRQQQDQYGEAYQQGGWESVRDTAGGFGDLQTAEGAQGVMDGQEETALARAQRSATVLANAATSLQGVPYEQRAARLQQMAPMLQGLGIDDQQLSTFDPTDENLEMVRGIQGQMSRFAEIREQGNDIVGITAGGQVEVLRQGEPEWQTNGTRPYRVTPQGQVEYGQGEIPVRPTAVFGQAPVLPLSPEQAQQWNIEDPAGWAIREGEAPTRIGGTAGSRGSPLERAQATADVQRLEALNAQADTDMSTVAALDRFSALNAQTDTSPTNPQAIGIGSWRPFADDETQQMVQVISQLTPQQRVPGSGATSDFDARMFTDALPGINRSREANEAIIGAYRARGQLSRERAEFAADWLDREGNLRQFDAEWRRYVEANPIFDRQSTPDNPILNTRRQDFATWYAQRSSGQGQTDAPRPGIAGAAAQVTGQPRSNEGRVRVWNRQTGRSE